ncbi:MAG: hypothetical protein K9K32_00120 [Halanaerobiales bacterium]|nr:hypothetical protein [Halanaerobiales bacterium]
MQKFQQLLIKRVSMDYKNELIQKIKKINKDESLNKELNKELEKLKTGKDMEETIYRFSKLLNKSPNALAVVLIQIIKLTISNQNKNDLIEDFSEFDKQTLSIIVLLFIYGTFLLKDTDLDSFKVLQKSIDFNNGAIS